MYVEITHAASVCIDENVSRHILVVFKNFKFFQSIWGENQVACKGGESYFPPIYSL